VAGSFRIAEGFVEVTADESGYDRAMQRLRQSKNKVKIGVELDDREARTALDRLTRPRVMKVRVDLDKTALTQLKMRDVEVSVLPKISDAAYRRVQTQLDRLTADRVVNIRASVDTRVAAQEIRNLIQRRQVRIGVDVDTRVAADSLANLTRRRTMTVQARADTTAANNSLRFLTRDRTVNVRANMSGLGALTSLASNAGGAAGSVGMLGSRFAALAAAALMALPAVASLSQAIVSMGPAAAIAVPALGSLITMGAALAVGLRGVGGAFKAASDAGAKTGASTANTARAMAAAHLNVARAARALKEAEQDAARQIAEARRKVREAAEDVRDAEVRAAADRKAALRRVADAERDLADAQKSAAQAQEDLNDARKEAAEQLEDLNSRLAGAQLDERQAVLDVTDAEKDLAAVKAKGSKATAEELAQAQLDYERAVQRLRDQQTETVRLREETAEANEAGVEGSDTVRAAQDRLADSQRNVGDRTRDVRDSQVEAAQVAKDGVEAVRDAQQRLADAQRGVADAQIAAARQVRSAQESLADAQRAVTAATERGAAATDKYAEAMAKLSPNARAFVTAVRDMGPAFSALRMEVQDRLFRGMGESFTRMATASLPALRSGLGGMADVLNNMGRGLMDTFTRLANEGLLKRMFDGFTTGMKPLEKVPGQFSEMFVKLGIAAAPAMKRVTTAIGNAFTRVGGKLDQAFKSGRLEEAIGKALDVAVQFGRLLGDIFGTVGNIMDAAAAGAGDALGGLGSVFKELRRITAMPEVQEALTAIFKALNDIAKLLAGTFGAVIQAALPLLAKLAPVVSELAQKFAPVLVRLAETLGKALMPIMDALLPVVEDLGDIIVNLVEAVMPLLKPIGDLLGTVVAALAPVLPVIGDIVTMLVRSLVTGLKPVIAALIPAVRTFGQFIGQLAPMLTPLYQAFVPLVPVLGQMSAALIRLAMQVIEPLLPLIVRLAGLMSGLLAGAINTIVPVITTVVKWLTTFANKAAEVVKWVVDQFKMLYDKLVGHSIIPDLVRDIVRWFTSLWTNTKRIFNVLKDWLVKTWRDLWSGIRDRWNNFWSGLRTSMSNAWQSVRNSVTNLRTTVSNAWNGLWNGARDKITSIFSTIRDRISSFKSAMRDAFTSLRDSLGRIWDGVKGKIASPVRYVISQVYNGGIRRMWNAIAGKINSSITLPTIKLGFNKGGVVPGHGNSDTVPAMLTPGERILSTQQVAQLGGHRGIDAMLGQDRPTQTGGNPSRQQERRRQQGPVQHFDEGGIVGNITSGLGKLGDAASWAKDLVVGGLKEAAQKALRSLVRPLIARIPNTGIGNLLRGLSNKAVDGMMGWFTKEDKKAVGGPGVQKALAWAKTQHGKPYQWGGNGNPSWDCSGLTSAIESVIRGERPHRRWATGSFVGNSGPSGWVRNLNSPYMIGITNAGVGHTAGTIAGVNVESRGGDGVIVGKGARSYKDSLFTSQWGFAPAAKFDSGGLLQPGATLAVNKTGRPERILNPQQTAMFEQLVRTGGGVTIENITVSGTFDFSSKAARKQAANELVAEMKEALRQYDRGRA
jgi:phage-related protein/phosphoribosylformylglycinamidine (FGAM) synthase PurS component